MRNFLALVITVIILGIASFLVWNAVKAGQEIDFSKIKLEEGVEIEADADKGEFLYEVKDGEAVVNDMLISRFLVGTNVSVAYRNTTEESLGPRYSIRLYNTYGLLIAEEKVKYDDLEPGDVGAQNILFTKYPLSSILEQSQVSSGEKTNEIKWIMVYETNTKVSE